MLLFDAYHKDERGGTGEVFDWSSLDEFERPFMLAGGIDSTNVARAIRTVRLMALILVAALKQMA